MLDMEEVMKRSKAKKEKKPNNESQSKTKTRTALTYGLTTVQGNSEVSQHVHGVSDAHDLVVARVFGTASMPTPHASSPLPRPTSSAASIGSAAQPVGA